MSGYKYIKVGYMIPCGKGKCHNTDEYCDTVTEECLSCANLCDNRRFNDVSEGPRVKRNCQKRCPSFLSKIPIEKEDQIKLETTSVVSTFTPKILSSENLPDNFAHTPPSIIALIVLVSLIVVLLVAGTGFVCFRKRRGKPKQLIDGNNIEMQHLNDNGVRTEHAQERSPTQNYSDIEENHDLDYVDTLESRSVVETDLENVPQQIQMKNGYSQQACISGRQNTQEVINDTKSKVRAEVHPRNQRNLRNERPAVQAEGTQRPIKTGFRNGKFRSSTSRPIEVRIKSNTSRPTEAEIHDTSTSSAIEQDVYCDRSASRSIKTGVQNGTSTSSLTPIEGNYVSRSTEAGVHNNTSPSRSKDNDTRPKSRFAEANMNNEKSGEKPNRQECGVQTERELQVLSQPENPDTDQLCPSGWGSTSRPDARHQNLHNESADAE